MHNARFPRFDVWGRFFPAVIVARYPTAPGPDPLPFVLVAHQWKGLGAMEKYRSEQLASRDYVAFVRQLRHHFCTISHVFLSSAAAHAA